MYSSSNQKAQIVIITINVQFYVQNAELNNEVRKLRRTLNDVNAWECDVCRRWRVNRKDQACQTIPNNTVRFCSTNSGIVEVSKNINTY